MGNPDKPQQLSEAEIKEGAAFAGKWVRGEVGNGTDSTRAGEYDPDGERPDTDDIQDRIQGLNEWRLTNDDQTSYAEWWDLWKGYAAGKRPEVGSGMEGWTKEDFQAVFSALLAPK